MCTIMDAGAHADQAPSRQCPSCMGLMQISCCKHLCQAETPGSRANQAHLVEPLQPSCSSWGFLVPSGRISIRLAKCFSTIPHPYPTHQATHPLTRHPTPPHIIPHGLVWSGLALAWSNSDFATPPQNQPTSQRVECSLEVSAPMSTATKSQLTGIGISVILQLC